MKITKTDIEGLLVVELDVYGDSRGFFVERFNKEKFSELGLPTEFDQDNHSRSAPSVLRGLHYQATPAQGKLVGCANGRIWDVAVDVRPDSPTFGQNFGLELSDENGKLLWMPPGFAHGFCVLGDKPADVFYKVTSVYNPKGESSIAWDDAELNVPWPFDQMEGDSPTVSDRDKQAPSFADYKNSPPNWD